MVLYHSFAYFRKSRARIFRDFGQEIFFRQKKVYFSLKSWYNKPDVPERTAVLVSYQGAAPVQHMTFFPHRSATGGGHSEKEL